MKKKNLFIATLLVVAATTIAVVSCKKETANSMLVNQPQASKMFYPEGVEDMNAYLKDFKHRMQTATRNDNESLPLEEAAWYLSSVANYDFANVNVEFTDLRYDTLHYQVNVTNGQVSLANLNSLYTNVASDIDAFYQNLNLENKHFRFIGASISNNGEVEVSLITSFRSLDHVWYFSDPFWAGVICDSLFSEDLTYVWDGLAKSELERIMNLLEGHIYAVQEQPAERAYYLYFTEVLFEYQNNSDPNGSPFDWNSRLFVAQCDSYCVPELDTYKMCYCIDSYLDLPFTLINSHSNWIEIHPVQWNIRCEVIPPSGGKWTTYCHDLKVKLARYIVNGSSIDY
jgi:hypothetical protein